MTHHGWSASVVTAEVQAEEIKMQITPGCVNAKAYHKGFLQTLPRCLVKVTKQKNCNTTRGRMTSDSLRKIQESQRCSPAGACKRVGVSDSHPTPDEGLDARKPEPHRAGTRALV